MTFTNFDPYLTDVIQYEVNINYTRERVTLNYTADGSHQIGEVLGRLTANSKYRQVDLGASDGTETSAGVLIENVTVEADTDLSAVILRRGPAIVADKGLIYPTGATQGNITTINGQLASLDILVQSAG